MKTKRLVSLLLAILLIAGMIPTNAFAALNVGDTSGKNVVNLSLGVSKTFGKDAEGNPIGYESANEKKTPSITEATIQEYVSKMLGRNGSFYAGYDSGKDLVDFYSKVFTPANSVTEVNKGEIIYLGVKASLENPQDGYVGLAQAGFKINFDSTEVIPLLPAGKTINDVLGAANAKTLMTYFATNALAFNQGNVDMTTDGTTVDEANILKYGGDFAILSAGNSLVNVSGTEYQLTLSYGGTDWYIPNEIPWDIVIPMVAQKSGTVTFAVAEGSVGVLGNRTMGSSITAGGTMEIKTDGSTNSIGAIKSNDVTATVVSNDPGASIPESSSIKDVAGQKLDVTLKNCTFASGAAATATNFEVWTTGASAAKVNDAVTASVAKGTDNKVATVTIDGSKLTAGTKYKIVVKNGAFTPATDPAGDIETGEFSVTAAPKPLTATFNYSNNQLSVTESVAWAWKIKTEANTAYHKVNSGAAATLTETDLAKIRTAMGNNNTLADAIQVIAQTDTAYEAVKNVSITKEATPTAPASALNLNFTGATPTVTAQSGYEVNDGGTYKTTAVNTTLGGTVKYRKAKGASSIASNDATYSVPRAGTLTGITNTTTRDKKLLGQTTVGGVQATDMIQVGSGTASAAGGTTKDVAAEEGVTITVTRPGTSGAAGTAQPSKTGTTTGFGFKKPTTLTATKPSSTTADLKLAIPSGKGKFNSTTVVAIKDGTTPVTAGTATLSDGTGTEKGDDVITITAPTGGWTEDKTYTVEVETTGTTPNLSAKFTTTFTVASAAGYTLKPSVETLTLTPDQFKATADGGAKTEVAIGNIPAGKQVNAVSVPAGKGTVEFTKGDAKFNYTPPATRPTNPEDITVTITLGDIEYDALTYEDTSVGHGSAISVAPKTKDARISDLKLKSVDPADKQSEFAVAADGTITVAIPDNLTPNTTYTVTVDSTSISTYTGTATIKVGKAGATVTVANKTYDGTNVVPADKITVTADKGGATLDITITGATYDNANVGANKAVSITAATIAGADAANYTVNTSGITGEIEQLTGAQVKAETTTAAQVGSIADIVAAVKKQTVTIDGVTANLGTVADIASDTDIETAVKAALDASGSAAVVTPSQQIAANVVEADASKASAAPIAVEQYAGGKITLTGIPDGATAAITTGSATLTDGVLTGLTSETVVVTVTPTTGDPYDVEIAVTAKADPTENVYDFTKLDATTLNITVSNITGDITTNTDATEITVTLPITKKSSSSGGGYVPSTGYTVAIENTGYGSVDTTAITTDEDGKIVSLPTVTNVKKGVSFVGWSTNGQISGVIDPNTFRVQNDELTLTAVYQGYMAGYEDSTARPNKQITRAELLKMLIVATGDYDATKNYGTSTFTDVKNAWYVNYIACAQQSGKDIIAGYGDGTFKPNAPVTRNEAARMICQAFGVNVSEGDTTSKVNDFDKVAGWAQKYVAALCNNGTIHGYEDGEFKGDRAVTRGESSVMINGYLGLTKEAKEQLRNDPALKNIFKDMTDKQAWNFIDVLFAAMCAPASYYSDEITMPQA